jgi:hypothetical protein
MSSPIWTPDALSSEARPFEGVVWRLVEAQHQVSTLKLTDDLAEQEILEALIEETKPVLPPECRHLDFLLSTPFRYDAPYPSGSRFRRAGKTPGVFYASEKDETAVAELAFYRLLFFIESPGTPWPNNAAEFTAFSVAVKADRSLNLLEEPLSRDRSAWTLLSDYSSCQALADAARAADSALIRYESVRDPSHGANLAILTCSAFSKADPLERRTWRLKLGNSGVQAVCEFPVVRLSFDRAAFGADPRIASFGWDRTPI